MFEMITVEVPWFVAYVTIPTCVIFAGIESVRGIYRLLRR